MSINKRKFFRIDLEHPLSTDITIVKVRDQQVVSKSARVAVDNIGPGGLKFITNLDLPVTSNVALEFELEIVNQAVKLIGYTVRKKQLSTGEYEYGATFTIDDIKQAHLSKLCNDMLIRQRRKRVQTGNN